MSLFIGNLSARTRGDDLQRVFRKFGQCMLNLKDRYGFVVYDFPQDAENALRALQGRNICGEPLILTWSKKQPIPFQGHQRVVRSYALHHGRHSARRGGFASRRMSSNDPRDYRSDINQPDTDGEKLSSVYMLNGGRGDPNKYANDDSREHHDLTEGLPVDGVAKLVDTANRIDNEVEFDRYEPCQSHEGEDEHENCQMAYSGCGSVPQRPQENARTVKITDTTLNRFNDLKSQNGCFSCGDLGHKIRDCPRKYSSGRKPKRFDHRQHDAIGKIGSGEAELERFGSISLEKLRLNKDSASGHRKSMRASDSGKSKATDRTQMKDRGGKKRSRWEGESPKRHSPKKARSVLSPPHSDYPASKSCAASQSSESVSRCSSSRARSQSVFMRAQSLSSDSRSSSKLIRSKSRSRSSSFTSSSESLSRSSYKAHVDLKCPVSKTETPKSKEILLEKRQPIGGDAQRVQNPGSDAAGCSSAQGSKEKVDPENSGGLVVGETHLKDPASEMHVSYCNGNSTCISSEEMCMVLKHYGMELPEESERHLPIEEYLGSARLWPWEIIYYRRLKKGLVSVENYARRVSQNQEFGIIDKYVRSSSGWGEIDEENPCKVNH
ncbi:putative transcription factor interactor and regulator CCHC(Zn) family [Rosa chinensis]|uniref:Putative transcription factor interactor and regulator CCHC(Zn) family n=1 Tax=Rosa chinensis TaxID=74649 RepID=A0A2P6RCA2_ROSCH|nr:serine/arginine-rich splicing factor 6 [Rosa chinensis]PRQ44069.1 putative transcription factor interactor and regulator CCHC(Zn) family [Rosa chinensis]